MDIATNVAYLAGLSMAAERLVEIFRGIKLPGFKCALPKNPVAPKNLSDVEAENKRIAKLNILAILTGVITAALAYSIHVLPAKGWLEVLMYGVLAGAGSGFWNAVLSYLLQLKASLPTAPTQVFVEGRAMSAGAGKAA
jgi:hypothetical protein